MYFKPVFRCLLLSATVGVFSACTPAAPPEEPVRAVKVLTVGAGTQQTSAEYSGEVLARVESRLGFRVAGKIIRRPVELGQRVKAGQVLAQLDPQDYKLSEAAARAQLAAAATNRDLAAADFKRYKDLKDQNFISSAELERRDSTRKAAQAQFDQAQAQLSGQGNQAAYTTLVADVSGVVTAVDAEVGQVVAAGTPVVRIAQDGARDVLFSVPEDKVQALRVGSAAQVKAWASQTTVQAKLREVAASADPVTRTYAVRAALDAKDDLPLGSTVSVTPAALAHGDQAVVKLPTSAIFRDGNASAVWVLDTANMTVKLTPVEIATADGNEVVLRSGLQPGMQVVSAGVHVLSPGQKVSLYQPARADTAAAPSLAAASAAQK
ncbi:efflux RND transporter periplasmic adaptor subunit [Rhodoferax lacus]|uniref:Efflux RND transporter periplasmic adaptor subunit n=1 Tax=Rhodoferax lacus TaxID=2184758 RepID=A0A3E1RGR5_9BURK|nr:efflux RND transporter periplasmic adaptor subunit [Rhodoferax lacus]RFO98431.1 efflux RND transporter periplasmic adaptor subunit [Rhodoferax lacus]